MADNPGVFAEFYLEKERLGFESERQGRDVHEMREKIRIVIAGDKHTEANRLATDEDRERFHEVYARFKRGEEARKQIVGTHISAAPFLNAALVADLEYLNIYTVEALADLSDVAKGRLGMGAAELVAKAKAFLSVAKDSAEATRLAAENERQQAENAELKRQIKELADRLATVEKGAPLAPPSSTPRGSRSA